MDEQTLMRELQDKLEAHEYRSRALSVGHVRDLQEGIERSHVRGLLDEQFYQECLTHFSFKLPDCLPSAQSLIVVAVPQPRIKLTFTWHGESWPVTIPPTYSHETDKQVEDVLSIVLAPRGYGVSRAALPLKYLAVRSGLGDYGRNNVCYVPGMGSYHRLAAFYTDFPCSDASWREPKMMERCQDCRTCLRSCPTGAIASDRFVIRAERCLTYHNERLEEFPDWIDSSWHNCLVGCLRCQRACPENKDRLQWGNVDYAFSEDETTLILNSPRPDRIPTDTARKLDQLYLTEYSEVLGRNLRALIQRRSTCHLPLD